MFLLYLHFIFDLHVDVLHFIFDVLLSFIDVFHFVVVSSFAVVFILLLFIHIFFSTSYPSPFRGLSPGFLHFIFYLQPSPLQIDSRHFHFRQFHLAASATALSEHFLPSSVFYFTLLPDILTCVYQGFPGSQQFFLEVCRASC